MFVMSYVMSFKSSTSVKSYRPLHSLCWNVPYYTENKEIFDLTWFHSWKLDGVLLHGQWYPKTWLSVYCVYNIVFWTSLEFIVYALNYIWYMPASSKFDYLKNMQCYPPHFFVGVRIDFGVEVHFLVKKFYEHFVNKYTCILLMVQNVMVQQ